LLTFGRAIINHAQWRETKLASSPLVGRQPKGYIIF